MAFDEEDPEQGVFFVKDDGRELRVFEYTRIGASEVIFTLPGLETSASYTLQLRTKYDGDTLAVGRLDSPLLASSGLRKRS